jgi:hypothetical protein
MCRLAHTSGGAVIGKKFPADWEETRASNDADKPNQNPADTGFWEDSRFVDAGINNLNCPVTPDKDELAFVKVFATGIAATEGKYINKMILMVRNWRSHAESWRKVLTYNIKKNEGIEIDVLKYPLCTEFILKYGFIVFDYIKRRYPLLIVNFEKLMEAPKYQCEQIKNFVGFGRWDLSAELIDKKHNHHANPPEFSKELEFEKGVFDFADKFHEHLSKANLTQSIIEELRVWHNKSRVIITETNKQWEEQKAKKAKGEPFVWPPPKMEKTEQPNLEVIKKNEVKDRDVNGNENVSEAKKSSENVEVSDGK